MAMSIAAVLVGLVLLVWSADRFVDGAAGTAKAFGVPSLLIGMIIVGFGTSAPEITVSVLASLQGNSGIALGNAYGSNIANIGLVLGVTALVCPIFVESQILKRELPVLLGVTALTALLVSDYSISFVDSLILLVVFVAVMVWMIWVGLSKRKDALADEVDQELSEEPLSMKKSVFWLVLGLVLMIGSSRLLVWGAVELAQSFGVSDFMIGLTVVAIGTSLPELASSIAAARKGEQDLAIGNVIGSNLFNTLAVVGLAGTIAPTIVEQIVFSRDILVMSVLTILLFAMGMGWKGKRTIGRASGGILLVCYAVYLVILTIAA